MADDITVTPGSGATIAADDVGGKLYQRVKLTAGADGAATDVSAAAPLPVEDANSDAALAALQAIETAVEGTQSVSVAALPLPTGAATAANQSTGNASLGTLAGAVAGTEMQVDVVGALPAGTNNIGDVDVLSLPALPAGTNSIGGTKDNGPQWTTVFGVSGAVVTSADVSTATAVTDAPTSGQKLVITDIILSVGSTAMQCDFEIETAGTVFLTVYMAANSTVQITPRSRLKLPTADKKLMLDTSAAGAVSCTVFYHSEA